MPTGKSSSAKRLLRQNYEPTALETGQRVSVVRNLNDGEGIVASPMYIENRRPRASGWLLGPAPGSTEFWFVQHPRGNRVAVYRMDELKSRGYAR